jgi:phospholipid/cholesterol/gamma-HCH transport system permease protein
VSPQTLRSGIDFAGRASIQDDVCAGLRQRMSRDLTRVAAEAEGLMVSRSILDVPTVWFLYNFVEMLWARDLVGIIVKGSVFSGLASLIACHEGLRRPEGVADDLGVAMWRAALLGMIAILLANSAWFTFMFLGGAPFGRTVLEPPVPR